MLDAEEIRQTCVAIDKHLQMLAGFADEMRRVRAALEESRRAQERADRYEIQKCHQRIDDLAAQLAKYGVAPSSDYEVELREVRAALDGPDWPAAVDPADICATREMAAVRAEGILDMFVCEHLKGKRFLDYGCGAGDAVPKAREREAAVAVGYDVTLASLAHPPADFTADFGEVRARGPFDIVLLHDVLDHAVEIDPVEILRRARSVLAPRGRVYARNHPWSARHGGHLYQQRNKAFLHLALDAVELTRVGGLTCEPNVRVVTPLETYRHWFDGAGLTVVCETPIRAPVEDYFLRPSAVGERLARHFPDRRAMARNLEIDFVEYVLEAAPALEEHVP